MNLVNPTLKSIPARDLDVLEGRGLMMALPVHVEVGGLQYKLSVPKNISGAIYASEEVLIPRALVDLLDIKYDLDINDKHTQVTVPPVFTEKDIPMLDIYPGDTPEILNIEDGKKIIFEFLEVYTLLTGDEDWKKLHGKELINAAKDNVEKLFADNLLGDNVVPSAVVLADLLLSVATKKSAAYILPLLSSLRTARFASLDVSDAVIFESTVLLVYLSLLRKISGPAFVYDYILGGIHPELKNLIANSGVAQITATIGGNMTDIKTPEDATKLLERFQVGVAEDGTVSVKAVDNITFVSAKIFNEKNLVFELTEEATINNGYVFPYKARLVNGNEVAVFPTIPDNGALTALTESDILYDSGIIGYKYSGDKKIPIYTTLLKPADYRGYSKLKAVVPVITTVGKLVLEGPEKSQQRTPTTSQDREDLIRLVSENKKPLHVSQKILEKSARLLERPLLTSLNFDSIFAPENREFVREYIKKNNFLLAPLGYNLSAQLISVLKLNSISARGRNFYGIPEYRQIQNALFSKINRVAVNEGILKDNLGELYEEGKSDNEVALSLMSYFLLDELAGNRALRAAAPQQLIKKYGTFLGEASIFDSKVVSVYPLSGFSGVLVLNIPGSQYFSGSRSGFILLEASDTTKVVIPLVFSITEDDVPQPNVGIQYIDGMVDVLRGAVAEEFIVYPALLISGYIHNASIELARTATEQYAVFLMRESLERELTEVSPHVHQNSVVLNINAEWLQAIGNDFIKKCRCKL